MNMLVEVQKVLLSEIQDLRDISLMENNFQFVHDFRIPCHMRSREIDPPVS